MPELHLTRATSGKSREKVLLDLRLDQEQEQHLLKHLTQKMMW